MRNKRSRIYGICDTAADVYSFIDITVVILSFVSSFIYALLYRFIVRDMHHCLNSDNTFAINKFKAPDGFYLCSFVYVIQH